MKEAS